MSLQWFLKVKELSQPALQVVLMVQLNFIQIKYKYIDIGWKISKIGVSLDNYGGDRIPVWYLPNGDFSSHDDDEAFALAQTKNPNIQNDLKQDEDVLDTWFSSWLWPMQYSMVF